MFISERCVGCGQCIAFCPVNAIEISGRAKVNENCINCEICKSYCPLDAIEHG
ncbi:MAG: 4Fe-4S binding protein [Methanocellales archaeon]